MNRKNLMIALVISLILILGSSVAVVANVSSAPANITLVADGLNGTTGMGSAIGPGGALYVTEGAGGSILKVDPKSGEISIFASGLPQGNPAIGIGGVMDVAFMGETAYALVTLVGADVGGNDDVGIYRIDGPNTFSLVADLGLYSTNNPPTTAFDVPSGVQYAIESYRGGFLVTDGHHNRVLHVSLGGQITDMIQFENIVPTGLDLRGNTIYMAEAGPIPHTPETGKIVSFEPGDSEATEVASGAKLNVDVEFGRGRTLFALSQGKWNGAGPGSSAEEKTGELLKVNGDGSMSVVMDGLNLPTSVEIIGNSAYITTLAGEIWRVDNISGSPFGLWK